jgi:DNA-binding NarL/FixJ family response regulator
MTRILIADDHEMIRHGLRKVLETRVGWIICGEATNGREAVAKALEVNPDVVVMDYAMPELNGLEATRQIRRALPHTEVLVLSMYYSEQIAREILAAGARGYLLKSDAGRELETAVENLGQHRPYFTSKVSELLLHGLLNPSANANETMNNQLTPREREIVQLVAEGKSTKEVADVLKISPNTTETHRAHIMSKLKLRSVSELVRYAIRNKMVEP